MSRSTLPEVHIIGELLHGQDFKLPNAFCKYQIDSGKHWDCVEGHESGQTQVDYPSSSKFRWNQPIELHYFIKTMQGWPKIMFQIGSLDNWGQKQVCKCQK